jgi:hypothetical protein
VNRTKGTPSRGARRPGPAHEPLEPGQRVRNYRTDQEGIIVDFACQYAHPKADPVYSYMVRLEDGQVLAITQAAMGRDGGYEAID